VEVHLPDVHKQVSGVDLGLPNWGKYVLLSAGTLIALMLIIFLMTCCRRVNRPESTQRSLRGTGRKVSVTSQSGKVISSWESYKSGGETRL
ncbi:TPA_asm: hypothetical protein G0J57_26180, partial [Salmonella enterica subsp. enterica serovar Typhimurium]|nr:hypothetical protein [Salmonella enterica subsp. enterica serovar Typhimurium]